jgi:hypothetical protein
MDLALIDDQRKFPGAYVDLLVILARRRRENGPGMNRADEISTGHEGSIPFTR